MGFVTKIEECMGACDCIITKVGSHCCGYFFLTLLWQLLMDSFFLLL